MRVMVKALFCLLCAFAAMPAFGKWAKPADPHVLSCIRDAATRYEHDYLLMLAMADTESSFRTGVINTNAPTKKNPSGSKDVGLFQINLDEWLLKLNKYSITIESLFDPCVNAHVAGWILWGNKKAYGNTWKAVGAFNSPTPEKQQEYIQRVWKNLIRLRGEV